MTHFISERHDVSSETVAQQQKTTVELKSVSLSVVANFSSKSLQKKRREKKTPQPTEKVAALLKLLCLSKQSGDLAAFWGRSMKAAHRQPQPWACYLCLLFIVSPTWIKDIKWNSSEKRRKTGWCLTEGGNRQLAESFGSGGCQGAGEMA